MNREDPPPDRRAMLTRLLWLGGLSTSSAGLATWLETRNRGPEQKPPLAVRANHPVAPDPNFPELVVVQGEDPGQIARKAVEQLGGIRRFISRGDVVVVKPNAGWDRTPEQAANTNPLVVGEVCRLCAEAGARKVIVTDVTINEPRLCFARSGIAGAARAEGAEVILPQETLLREVDLRGEVLRSWPVLEPFLNADKLINIPVAKHHSLTRVTLVRNSGGPSPPIASAHPGERRRSGLFHAPRPNADRRLPSLVAKRAGRRKSGGCIAGEDYSSRDRPGRPGRSRRRDVLAPGLAGAPVSETGERSPSRQHGSQSICDETRELILVLFIFAA